MLIYYYIIKKHGAFVPKLFIFYIIFLTFIIFNCEY